MEIGRYHVERRLGSGAFATVWLAHDPTLEAPVAIKVLADNWSHDLDVRERFVEEARILWRADHPRLVRVHVIDELPTGQPYFVMAYADRGSLLDRLRAGAAASAPMSLTDATWIASEIAEGLDVLHELGFVHRDLKPSNVLFRSVPAHHRSRDRDEEVMLADLGLAKAMAFASGYTVTTGTPAYMAPEQATAAGGIDRRADVHGLGAVVYEMVSGRPPFDDADAGAVRHRSHTATSLRETRQEVPAAYDSAVRRALEPDREKRFATASDLADALTAACPVTLTAPRSTPPRPPRPRRARRRVVAGAIAGVLAIGGGAVAVARAASTDRAPCVVPPSSKRARVWDRTGRLCVVVPAEWSKVRRGGWKLADDPRALGLIATTDLERYDGVNNSPGVFVGASTELAKQVKPTTFVEEKDHPNCDRQRWADLPDAGRQWANASFDCHGVTFWEAATQVGQTLIYVQIKALRTDLDTAILASVKLRS